MKKCPSIAYLRCLCGWKVNKCWEKERDTEEKGQDWHARYLR